ncbi:proline-rich protein 5 isoform X4 [Ciconia boyciana]|uniref:proline-rich protein 5 isoform X4 n=1 Tax=Ciconia boyciana TaxID=52775 RepID=UPI003B9EBB86
MNFTTSMKESGQKLLDTLAETWDFFFSDVLPMLQAIFYPVQGKEPSVRQLALLHFRNIITLNIKLEDALSRSRARVPPSIIQMLLILQTQMSEELPRATRSCPELKQPAVKMNTGRLIQQRSSADDKGPAQGLKEEGVHESKGVTEDYLKLESLIQKVVSPYLGTYGLYSSDGPFTHSSCILEKRFFRRSKSGDILAKNPVVRSKSYNNPLLTPVAEYETEGMAANGTGIRRHSVSEMTSCLELQGYSNLTTIMDNGSKSSMTATKSSLSGDQERPSTGSVQCSSKLSTVEQQKGLFHSMDDPHRSFELNRDPSLIPVPSSSPENIVDQILESIDSDSEGIFIDFGRGCSNSSAYNVDVNRQSIM